eukprot:COSAG04_NODE_345_length_16159_cov_5.383126_8_plen_176_part_00
MLTVTASRAVWGGGSGTPLQESMSVRPSGERACEVLAQVASMQGVTRVPWGSAVEQSVTLRNHSGSSGPSTNPCAADPSALCTLRLRISRVAALSSSSKPGGPKVSDGAGAGGGAAAAAVATTSACSICARGWGAGARGAGDIEGAPGKKRNCWPYRWSQNAQFLKCFGGVHLFQ